MSQLFHLFLGGITRTYESSGKNSGFYANETVAILQYDCLW